jgi:hypothetical protein
MFEPVWVMWGNQTGPWCCIAFKKPAPVPFCDLHVESLRWDECVKDGVRTMVPGSIAGVPIFSTWYGYRGRDRAH